MMFVLARNAKGRPMLQHIVAADNYTRCGYLLTGWSREYTSMRIPILLCKKCEPPR